MILHSFFARLFFDMPLCCALRRELPMTDGAGSGLNSIAIAVLADLVASEGPCVLPWAIAANVTHQLLQLLWRRMVLYIFNDLFSSNIRSHN